jgi:hypothetical protein
MRACLFGVCALVMGCAGMDTSARARERAVEVLSCPTVDMTQLEEYRFHAVGCGQTADFACTAGSLEPTCIRVASAGGEHVVPPPPSEVESPVSASSSEAAIRAGLDARRSDIFACTQHDPTIVRVAYTADGAIDVHLGGGLESSPEEGCVRAALAGARAPGGESGTVLHLVHGS